MAEHEEPLSPSVTPVGGRYPFGLAVYRAASIRASLHRRGDVLIFRIDDIENIDAWQEFTVSVADVANLLLGAETSVE